MNEMYERIKKTVNDDIESYDPISPFALSEKIFVNIISQAFGSKETLLSLGVEDEKLEACVNNASDISMMAASTFIGNTRERMNSVIECNRYIKRVSSQEIRFVKHANGIIQDTKTGLEWFVGPDEDMNHYEAEKWVNSLNVAGGGWSMPSIKELRGIYDSKKRTGEDTDMGIDPVFFSDWKYASVWSRELLDENNNPSKNHNSPRARFFTFYTGYGYWDSRSPSFSFRVFAVRSGRRG